MCPSSWKLYLDDFPFLGSSLAHLEPKLELFEFWEFGSWWLFVARLYPIYVLFAFKMFLLPVPTRPGTRPFLQVPDPSRPKVKNPYPSDPARGILRWAGQSWYTEILSHLMKKWKLNDKDTNSCYETQCRVSTYRFQADIYQWSPNLPKTWRK